MSLPPRFSAEIRARFPAQARLLDACEQAGDESEARLPDQFTAQRRSDGRLFVEDAVRWNMHGAHARARWLTWGIINAVNENLCPSLFLAIRAHFEMAGMMAHLLRCCQQFRESAITEPAFEEHLDRLYLGRRFSMDDDPASGIPSNEKAIQVLDLIDSADRVWKTHTKVAGAFREAYEWLSEFCHPNLQSRMSDYTLVGAGVLFHRVPELNAEDLEMALNHAQLSHFLLFDCFTDCAKLLEGWPTSGGSA